MATSQQQLVCDSSTLANFKAWAQPISTFFGTAGWVQGADTGQVNWGTIAAVPGSGAFVYEIWKPGDALTVFYARVEYGNVAGTNCPSLKISIGTGTNGAGTLTGFILGPVFVNNNSFTAPSTTTQYECDFSGSTSRIGVLMWRNGANSCQQYFGIERSIDSSGAYTSAYVTLWTAGLGGNSTNSTVQGSVVFGVGVAPINLSAGTPGNSTSGWISRFLYVNATTAFNGSIPFDTCTPCIGYFDYPATQSGVAYGADITEGVTFTVTLYGSTRTYMPTKNGNLKYVSPLQGGGANIAAALCMRYD